MYKILDVHAHIFPDKIAVAASKATGDFYGVDMTYDGKVNTLKSVGDAAGVTKFVVHSVATTAKQPSKINKFVSETVKNNSDIMIGFGSLHPESDSLEDDFAELLALGLKGVKLHPDIQKVNADSDGMFKIYELCEKNSLPVLIHCGDHRYDYSNPNRIIPILKAFKGLTVIGAHLGGYTVWKDAAKELSGYDNLYVDSSSSLFALEKEEAREIISAFGYDKVLFGADFPMWDIKGEVDRLLGLDFPEEINKKILWENGARLLKL